LKVSLIITTYNWPRALSVVLRSVMDQTWPDFEIIIADDGSDEGTAETVKTVLSNSRVPWRHVRHQDSGIRQARVKNLAVRYSDGDYFIFIDHDVALHPMFIQDHVGFADPGLFLQGKRVFLSDSLTEDYLATGWFHFPPLWAAGLENRKNAFRCPVLARLINRRKKFQVTLRGCNLSMYRATFMAVDGYDEVFDDLWGREDSDICYRIFNNGFSMKNLWPAGLQYHLHHAAIKRRGRDRLDDELDKVLKEKRTRALQGYSTMSAEGAVIARGNPAE
jgi:glycosyltransferase involved in cell wall biosynthesis